MKWFLAAVALGIALLTFDAYGIIQSNEESPDNDTIDGEFQSTGYNNPTEVTNFEFRKANTTTAIVSGGNLTPNQEYYVKFEIYDRETIADVTRVAIAFFDNHGYVGGESDTFRGNDEPGVSDNGNEITFAWYRGDSLSSPGAIGFPSNSNPGAPLQNTYKSWEIIQSTAPAVGSSADNLTEAAFEFIFRMSKVAREGTNNWRFGYLLENGVLNGGNLEVITHAGIQTGQNPDGGVNRYSMNWYGDITVPTSISWSGINPGIDYTDAASVVTATGFKYFANGDFETVVQVSNSWTPSATRVDNVQNAQLTDAGIIDSSNPAQAFSMRIAEQEVTGTESNSISNTTTYVAFVPNPSDVNNYSQEIVINDGHIRTLEQGIYFNSADDEEILEPYIIYLKTSSDLQNATYSGEFKFTIRNR